MDQARDRVDPATDLAMDLVVQAGLARVLLVQVGQVDPAALVIVESGVEVG